MGEQEGEGAGAEPMDLGMGTFCLALTIGILSRAWIAKFVKLPYTVIVRGARCSVRLIAGLCVGEGGRACISQRW
jgi:hypothetical protein